VEIHIIKQNDIFLAVGGIAVFIFKMIDQFY